MQNIYETVTAKIIASLEAGTPPWIRPWTGEVDPVPINAGSRRAYRGINRVLLTLEGLARGYNRNAWLTYRQASELGGQVRGGEHGAPVIFYRLSELPADGEEEKRSIPLLRGYTVFNIAQIEGLPAQFSQPAAPPSWEPLVEAERLLTASGATIHHGGFTAAYRPADDVIMLPEKRCFATPEDYYATTTHELTHWTGHASRCNRQLAGRFGENAYAVEELIAEMGSAFVCAQLRLEGKLQHASYVASWLRVLKSDKRAVFTAAAKAQQAADFILSAGGSASP